MKNTLNVAIVGIGAFGQNHLRIYHDLSGSQQPSLPTIRVTAIVEPDPRKVASLNWPPDSPYPLPPVYESVEALLNATQNSEIKVDAASVCVPTTVHANAACALLASGIDVLVEKPIATTVAQAEQMIAIANRNCRILQVGHLERFNPAVLAAEAMRSHPMFFEAHRLSIFSPRALDVDVVLDLMIHDLDIVLHLAQSSVQQVHAVGLPIVSSKVDIANVRIEFESGCVANFTASRISTERVRKLRFFQPHQYMSLDYARKDLLVIDVAPDTLLSGDSIEVLDGSAASIAELPPGLRMHKPPVTQGEPLRLEISAFLESVVTRMRPKVTGEDGCRALALAIRIHEAMSAHAHRAGLERFTL